MATPALRWFAGFLLLAISLGAAAMMVLEHLGGLELPGCGPGSACAQAAASRWGSVAGWPSSFLGTAYFASVLVLWLALGYRRELPAVLPWIARAGGLGSLLFLAVIAMEGHHCLYCLTIHAANLLFVGLVEFSRHVPQPLRVRPLVTPGFTAVAVFALVSAGLGWWESTVEDAVADREEEQLQGSLERILAKVQFDTERAESTGEAAAFTGRYRQGPPRAQVRFVVLSDYQCPDCAKAEEQIRHVMQGRDDISLSAKHYPLCHECNRFIKYKKFHEHACRAARAAEAAGIVGGEQAFWAMHGWLNARLVVRAAGGIHRR